MSNPVILLGTQSNGETLPVQVDATGRLVAEGLQGPEGIPGLPGPPGADGGSFPLPPDPYEGALLGWLDGGLAWVGAPPVPIPEGVFGPITSWDPETGVLTVAGSIPETIGNGVNVIQVDALGMPFVEGWNAEQQWSDRATETGGLWSENQSSDKAFNGFTAVNDGSYCWKRGTMTTTFSGLEIRDELAVCCYGRFTGGPFVATIGGETESIDAPTGNDVSWIYFSKRGAFTELTETTSDEYAQMTAIRVDGRLLVDRSNVPKFRVQQIVNDNTFVGSFSVDFDFTVGQYLKVPQQRVAPWVLYGNDPTSLIDHLRQERD